MLLIAALLATAPVRAQETMPAPAVVAAAPPAAAGQPAATPATVVAPRQGHAKGDPLEGLNRKLYKFHQGADRSFFRPLALFYKTIIPKFLRTGVRHILSNLGEPLVFMNDMLQLKPKRALRTFARVAINSSIGVGGILDVAKTTGLPHHPNSLGDTLARYGVGPGPYLFIPFYGPTDIRDLLGGQVENLVFPLAIGFPFDRTDYQISAGLVAGLDLRAESDQDFKALLDGAADPYATLRSVYLQSRQSEISEIKGETPATGLDDPLLDPEAGQPMTPADDGTPADAPQPGAAPATGVQQAPNDNRTPDPNQGPSGCQFYTP